MSMLQFPMATAQEAAISLDNAFDILKRARDELSQAAQHLTSDTFLNHVPSERISSLETIGRMIARAEKRVVDVAEAIGADNLSLETASTDPKVNNLERMIAEELEPAIDAAHSMLAPVKPITIDFDSYCQYETLTPCDSNTTGQSNTTHISEILDSVVRGTSAQLCPIESTFGVDVNKPSQSQDNVLYVNFPQSGAKHHPNAAKAGLGDSQINAAIDQYVDCVVVASETSPYRWMVEFVDLEGGDVEIVVLNDQNENLGSRILDGIPNLEQIIQCILELDSVCVTEN